MRDQILGERRTSGGETVCTSRSCSACAGGICKAAFSACELPEPEPEPRSRITFPRNRAFLIGAGLAGCGALFILAAAVRHLT